MCSENVNICCWLRALREDTRMDRILFASAKQRDNEGDSLENVESVKTSNKDGDKCHCFLIVSRTLTGWAVFDPDCSGLTQTSSFQCPWAFIADFFCVWIWDKTSWDGKKVIRILVLIVELTTFQSQTFHHTFQSNAKTSCYPWALDKRLCTSFSSRNVKLYSINFQRTFCWVCHKNKKIFRNVSFVWWKPGHW